MTTRHYSTRPAADNAYALLRWIEGPQGRIEQPVILCGSKKEAREKGERWRRESHFLPSLNP